MPSLVFLLSSLMFLSIFGAGCSSRDAERPTETPTSSVQIEKDSQPKEELTTAQTTETPEISTSTPMTPEATSSLVTVDDTWQTYHNKALNFEFRWPTKGIYAPTWEVKFYRENDPLIREGCVVDTSYVSKETYKDFCHSRSSAEVGGVSVTDYFATKKGEQYIVIIFTKQLANYNKCHPSQNGIFLRNSCTEFNRDAYETVLNTSISTFRFTE